MLDRKTILRNSIGTAHRMGCGILDMYRPLRTQGVLDDVPLPPMVWVSYYAVIPDYPDDADFIRALLKALPLERRPEGHPVVDKLHAEFPNLHEPFYFEEFQIAAELAHVIVHLNDSLYWTREQIADWLDTQDIDLKLKDEHHANPNARLVNAG